MPYRKAHTLSCKKWLDRLQAEKIPFLVCLTYADKLYAEHMSTGSDQEVVYPEKQEMLRVLDKQLHVSCHFQGVSAI